MNFMDKIEIMEKENPGYWGRRIMAQAQFACQMSQQEGLDISEAQRVIDGLFEEHRLQKGIGPEECKQAEAALAKAYGVAAKAYKVIHVGHAHIDMNWMWRFDETVAITLDTFRTVLALMDDYPAFTFLQSQASVYRIVEEFAPELLPEIQRRIQEGRWEVVANTWVEADKNLPNGESMARHLLYTRQYLTKLLNLDDSHFQIDFEPDTFGHSAFVPEVLAQGGVKYYYHCRGFSDYPLYRWEAPTGKSVLAFCEPTWYNGFIPYDSAKVSLWFAEKTGCKTGLWIYGVGDHGGGPTRKDIQEIMDRATWPVFPNMVFGSTLQFFQEAEAQATNIPVVNKELNYIFNGCYTTQSRIKQGNDVCQRMLRDVESLNAFTQITANKAYDADAYGLAWRDVLFNQFHDILTGSGMIDTREYAMGLYQQTMASAGSRRMSALRALASKTNTLPYKRSHDLANDNADGAGVGFGVEKFGVSQVSVTGGIQRPFHIFNHTPYTRDSVAEVTLWDWPGDINRIEITDPEGNTVPHQLLQREGENLFYSDALGNDVVYNKGLKNGKKMYWAHYYIKLAVKVRVPAMGYTTCFLDQRPVEDFRLELDHSDRFDPVPPDYVLANEKVSARFDSSNALLLSFKDNATGKELLKEAAGFRYIVEDPILGMTSWIVGRAMSSQNVHEGNDVRIIEYVPGPQRQWLSFEVAFGQHSKLKATVTLEAGSPVLKYDVYCRFLETGSEGEGVKQLHFNAPLNYCAEQYRCDVPMGDVWRKPLDADVPSQTFAVAAGDGASLMMLSDCKHGFLCKPESLGLTLIRSAFLPDPLPELHEHWLSLALAPVDANHPSQAFELSEMYTHPLTTLSGQFHAGDEALTKEFLRIHGNAALSSVKMAENGQGMILRVFHLCEEEEDISIDLFQQPKSAARVDMLEKQWGNDEDIRITPKGIVIPVKGRECVSVRVRFA